MQYKYVILLLSSYIGLTEASYRCFPCGCKSKKDVNVKFDLNSERKENNNFKEPRYGQTYEASSECSKSNLHNEIVEAIDEIMRDEAASDSDNISNEKNNLRIAIDGDLSGIKKKVVKSDEPVKCDETTAYLNQQYNERLGEKSNSQDSLSQPMDITFTTADMAVCNLKPIGIFLAIALSYPDENVVVPMCKNIVLGNKTLSFASQILNEGSISYSNETACFYLTIVTLRALMRTPHAIHLKDEMLASKIKDPWYMYDDSAKKILTIDRSALGRLAYQALVEQRDVSLASSKERVESKALCVFKKLMCCDPNNIEQMIYYQGLQGPVRISSSLMSERRLAKIDGIIREPISQSTTLESESTGELSLDRISHNSSDDKVSIGEKSMSSADS